MTTLIIVVTAATVIIGVGVVAWSILDTRKKYFNEYIKRKRK